MSLKFAVRGKILFIVSEGTAPVPFTAWAEKVINGDLPIECTPVQGVNQTGNFSVGIGKEGWSGVANFRRVAALVDIHRALVAGGIEAEGADGAQVLNLATSGPKSDDSRGRSARMNLFLNLGNQAKASAGTGPTTTTVVNSTEQAYSVACEAYEARGGDLGTFLEAHGDKPMAVQTVLLGVATKKLPVEQTEAAEEDQVGM
jgi:hypothetical protein